MKEFRASSATPANASSWSADEDANLLMDDVFSDIDTLLSGKQPSAKIENPPQEDYSALQVLAVPLVDADPLEEGVDTNTTVVIKRGWGYYSERFLLIGSSAMLVAAVLWMAINDRFKTPQFLAEPVVEVEVDTEAIAEPVFANYVQQALDNLDRQPAPQLVPMAGQPQVGIPLASDQNPTANGQAPQVIERIYIPVYPPEAAVNNGESAVRPPIQTAPPIIVQTPAPQPVAPAPVAPAPAPTLISPPPPMASVPTIPAPPAVAKTLYTLSGVLESGDRSAALFNVNGLTQRYKVGENIGTSNWKLLSLRGNQVMLGQGGQTKTLYTGESFSVDQ
ncbi:MAG: hypothetical protein WBB82_18285 [Limnothrix sp.]